MDTTIAELLDLAFDEIDSGPGTFEFFEDVQDRYAREAQRTGNDPDKFLREMNTRALRRGGAI